MGESDRTVVSVLRAAARQRCPACLEGRVFTGAFAMNESCPACGHRFERAPGFFVGAMYVSYALAAPLCTVLAVLLRLVLPGWDLLAIMGLVAVLFMPFVPVIFRLSRIIWMHLMRQIDPTG